MDRVSRCQNSVDLAPVRPFICRKCMLTITEVMSRGNASCHTRVCTNKLTLSRREKNKKQKLFLFLEDVSTRVREVKGYSFRAGMWCSRGWIDGKMYRSVNQINLFTHTSVRLCVSVTPRPCVFTAFASSRCVNLRTARTAAAPRLIFRGCA